MRRLNAEAKGECTPLAEMLAQIDVCERQGVAIGEVVSVIINAYSPLPAYIPLWAILLGLAASAGVGVIFGVFPAWKASKLDPIEALRFE